MSHISKQKKRRWDVKAEECILIGFDEESNAYRLYNLKTKKVPIQITGRDVFQQRKISSISAKDGPDGF